MPFLAFRKVLAAALGGTRNGAEGVPETATNQPAGPKRCAKPLRGLLTGVGMAETGFLRCACGVVSTFS